MQLFMAQKTPLMDVSSKAFFCYHDVENMIIEKKNKARRRVKLTPILPLLFFNCPPLLFSNA